MTFTWSEWREYENPAEWVCEGVSSRALKPTHATLSIQWPSGVIIVDFGDEAFTGSALGWYPEMSKRIAETFADGVITGRYGNAS